MDRNKIEQEIEQLKADQLLIENEQQALTKRTTELATNWHRLAGAIIAYQKVIAMIDEERHEENM